MTQVEAIFRHGVFEPLEPVDLPEEQRVQLRIDPAEAQEPRSMAARMKEWIEDVRVLREKIRQREGILPDSTLDIAEDRRR